MVDVTRRELIKGATLLGTAVAAGGGMASAQAQAAGGSAFAGDYQPVPLPFDPAGLDGLSENLIQSHWQNNYGGSVRALNAVLQRLSAALDDPELPAYIYNDLKREHLMRTGSVVLHEFYFGNLGGDGRMNDELARALDAHFGDAARWEREFRRIGAGLGGGSGWVVLGYNTQSGLLENYWLWDHLHGPAATMPLLVMDMYEHSYHMDFGAATARYIDAFMANVDWTVVGTRLREARMLRGARANAEKM